ncbi:hypothetical protein N657DRAFT_649547 [Parathielavia appendiculata]|uniref:Uncharacterized protein n=1 Tax=Parathielavia appendiculata TaxID=2587402 RepID=A0AAN6YZK8_9PEZI|nr:hypothetical protein N657DRAFT_649547 [Parathielavia appendiculata]
MLLLIPTSGALSTACERLAAPHAHGPAQRKRAPNQNRGPKKNRTKQISQVSISDLIELHLRVPPYRHCHI